jgi:O-antigen ligase/cytochrome c-type biogenesis protein CcmH/NrfG
MKDNNSRLRILPAGFIVLALMLAPFAGGVRETMGTAGLSILAFVAAAAMLWNGRVIRPVAFWPFAAFVALLAASAVITASLHATIGQTLYFAGCAAAALVASSAFRDAKWFVWALLGMVGVGAVLGLMGVREYANSGGDWRVFGPFESPGFFGGYLVLIVPVTLAALLAVRSTTWSAVLGVVWGLVSASLVLTGTRFAIGSALVACLAFVILSLCTRSLGKTRLGWLGIAVAVALVAAVLASAPTAARMRGKAASEQAHSGPFRVATWKGTANVIRAHPVLGTGAGTFELVFPRYMVAGYTRMAHNGYLQIASEAGIPSLIALATAFGMLVLAGIRGLKRSDEEPSSMLGPDGVKLLACSVLAALVGSLVRNVMDSDFYNPGIGFTFWILAGLAASRALSGKEIRLALPARIGLTTLLLVMAGVWYTFVLGQVNADSAAASVSNGEVQPGMDRYRSAVAIDPLNGEYWLRLGQMEALTSGGNESQWREGIDHIRKAGRLEPTRARDEIVLGGLLADHGDRAGAVRAYRKALELDPHATPAMLAVARLLGGSEADAMYQRLLDEEKSPFEMLKGVPELVNPDYAWAHYHFGEKLMNEGRSREAAAHFRAVVDRLKKRESYQKFQAAAREAGMTNPEEEDALKMLLQDASDNLARGSKP